MNFDSFKDIWKQFISNWKDFSFYQQFSVVTFAAILIGAFFYIVVMKENNSYVPLFQYENLQPGEISEIENYLTNAHIHYNIGPNSTLYIPAKNINEVKLALAAQGIPKITHSKGFDLFDNNTWIKGEKELQILEVRALKGQLEHDIGKFENIRSATVILEIATPRPFGNNSVDKTKASVILSLKPGTFLSQSEIQAITYHVAGAVRGLKPNMVAISDTTGKLYQPLDAEGNYDPSQFASLFAEENLKNKINGLLNILIGQKNYYSSIHLDKNLANISVDILIDSSKFSDQVKIRNEIVQQLHAILSPYQANNNINVNFAEFYQNLAQKKTTDKTIRQWPLELMLLPIILFALLVGTILWLLTRKKPISKKKEEKITQTSTNKNLEEMIEALKIHVEKDPKPLAKIIHNSLKREKYE